MEKKYLLFGHIKHCQVWADERNQPFSSYKIVKKPSDYLGYRDVELVYCGPYDFKEQELFEEATKYFKSH